MIPIRSRREVAEAIRGAGTIEEAAARVGLDVPTLRFFVRSHHMDAAIARFTRPASRPDSYALVDMTGRELFGGAVLVEERLANVAGNATWRVLHRACGHRDVYAGIRLRAQAKAGRLLLCRACKATNRASRTRQE